MDVISSSTSLPSDLNSADTTTTSETLDTSTSDTSIKAGSEPDSRGIQEDVRSDLSEVSGSVNSVENVNNVGENNRTIINVQENVVDSDNVNEPEPESASETLDDSNKKDSIECATSSVSDAINACEQSKSDETKEASELESKLDTPVNTETQNSNEASLSNNEDKVSTITVSEPEPTESNSNDAKTLPEEIPETEPSSKPITDAQEEKPVPSPKLSDKSSDKSDDKSEEKSEDKSEEKSEDKSEEKSEDKSTEKSEDKSTEKSEDKSTEKSEVKPIQKSEEKSSENSEDKSEQKPSLDAEPHLSVDSEVTSTQDAVEAEEPVEDEKMDVDGENKDDVASESPTESRLFANQSPDSDTSKEKELQLEDLAIEDNQNASLEKSVSVRETETNTEVHEPEENQLQTNDVLSEADDQSMDRDIQQENPVFVHVGSKGDGEAEGDKPLNSDVDLHNETGDESMEVSCLAEVDPIGITQENDKDDLMDFTEETSDKDTIKVVDFNDETITSDKTSIDDELVASKGADEELCIIPDTEREITQEEKDAATAAAAAAAELPRSKDDTATTTDTSLSSAALTEDAVVNSSEKPANSIEDSSQASIDEEFMASVNNTTTDVPEKPQIKVVEIPEAEAIEEPCHQCRMVKKCYYKVDNTHEKPTFLCNETCLISFRTYNKPPIEGFKAPLEGLKLKDIAKKIPGSDPSKIFVRKCAECSDKIKQSDEKVLSWETMDFCNEDCLSRYQNRIGSHCANCKKSVLMSSLGKYCVRFGHDIRQFCCSICLEEFKKGLKVCSYCQKDISGGIEGFLAPVGDKGQFKDFCSQLCMEKYDQMSNKVPNSKFTNVALPVEVTQCSVCTNEKQVQVNFDQQSKEENKRHKFCSSPCFVAFRFVNQIDPLQCDMCKNYFENENCTQFSIFYDNLVKNFCCKTCQNIYIIANRRIVPCSWCKVKKYNFDMIKKSCNTGQILMMCSLNCLSLFQVSVNAVSSKKMKCDYCAKVSQAQYHLTMSDATIRNFCTYHCVMSFQSQFAKLPITLGPGEKPIPKPVPASGPKKYSNRGNRPTTGNETGAVNEVRMPVITNVESLANNGTAVIPRPNLITNAVKINSQQNTPQPATSPKPQVKQQIIVKAPPFPLMKNMATWCKPILHTKGVSCRPHPCTKETQTDEIKEKTVLIPVPVPVYVPAPLHMFSAPVPVPIPFPLPIPVPVFIPTTRNSAAGIMKEIKKIQVKIPTDPFEAELLMMAEMVAGEKKVDNTDSESEEDDNGDAGADGGFSPEAVDTSNTFGDDMLQMALKMATELDEPAVDLEGALTANTITASQNQDSTGAVVATEEAVDDPQPMHQLIDRQNIPIRGRKRTNRQARNLNSPAKRSRRMSSHVEMPLLPPPQPTQPPEPIEKPDANMCLKYTFGVNAWKQWVTTKNAELEKSSRRVKLFKNEILQLTADELNYSLCLFVKEVRKPNGTEYAPDTIYYLCLGIQQYLFENGRIDNIFTDAYYEKFTDCLDEVARKFSVLYNDSHYIVTRVEEEHLWESKQLGAHSPHVLLSTLMFFNTKHFNLTTVDEHMQLSFSHIMKHWKRNPNQPGAAKIPGSRNVLLRFYPPQTTLDSNSRKKKVYEQQENEENPLRCPVKLYEFYLSKCPESVKTRNDVFYLLPERSCVPDSPVWYSTMALGREALEKMLHRVKMVKEINVALLTS